MSIFQHINEISDMESLKVNGSIMQPIARLCMDIMTKTRGVPYHWDVIVLYFAPADGAYEQKESYDSADTMGLLKTWLRRQADVSSTDVARALQALEYIIDTSNDPGDATALADLEDQMRMEYRRLGSPLS